MAFWVFYLVKYNSIISSVTIDVLWDYQNERDDVLKLVDSWVVVIEGSSQGNAFSGIFSESKEAQILYRSV